MQLFSHKSQTGDWLLAFEKDHRDFTVILLVLTFNTVDV
jgi:hypothetical protein